jgi:redox-sensitive bicupin YhaK (pirin superfamily)
VHQLLLTCKTMMNVISANERHLAANDWLKSYSLLSFGNYIDPNNTNYGPLRVFNDSYLAPKGEIPDHSHTDLEILTIVLDGALNLRDSLGNDKTIGEGGAARISAGLGMSHSITNDSDDDEAHLLQLWFEPNTKGLTPSFELKEMDYLDSDDKLIPIATGQKVLEDVIFINSNSTVYYANLGSNKEIRFNTFKIRKTLFYLLKGSLFVNGVQAEENDQLRLEDQEFLDIKASADASFIMVDVPAVLANY